MVEETTRTKTISQQRMETKHEEKSHSLQVKNKKEKMTLLHKNLLTTINVGSDSIKGNKKHALK